MKYLLLLPLLALVVGCKNYPNALVERGQVRHTIIVWLKPGGDSKAVVNASEELSQIPGVVDITIGTKIASERPQVDSTYDLALTVTFENEAAMRAYDDHPIHKKVLERAVKPNVAKFVVYDSTVDFYTWGKTVDEGIAERRAKAYKKQRDIVDNAH